MNNSVNWFEMPVGDLRRAMAFYAAVTQRDFSSEAYGAPGEEMAVFKTDSQEGVTGALVKSANAKPSAQGTLVYLNAEPSVDAWLARVEKAGGSVVVPKTALPPGLGYFAHFTDSEGNRVGCHAMA